MIAESTGSRASGAGGQARSRSPRGPEPWRGGAPGHGLRGLSEPLILSLRGLGPETGKRPSPWVFSPPPPRSLRRPRDATAREEAGRNKGTRRRARGASRRGPSSSLPACRKVDRLEDKTPGSGPGCAIRRHPLLRGSRGRLASLSWPSISDWSPAFAWAACGVRAWMEEVASAAAAPPPSGLLERGNIAPRAP